MAPRRSAEDQGALALLLGAKPALNSVALPQQPPPRPNALVWGLWEVMYSQECQEPWGCMQHERKKWRQTEVLFARSRVLLLMPLPAPPRVLSQMQQPPAQPLASAQALLPARLPEQQASVPAPARARAAVPPPPPL